MRVWVLVLWVALVLIRPVESAQQTNRLAHAAEPPDNPYTGFAPHIGSYENFPHSLEFFSLPLNSLMTGPAEFSWLKMEESLEEIAGRGHHSIIRVYLEYPGGENGIPSFLTAAGLKTHRWTNESREVSVTPNYDDPKLRAALREFVQAFGKKYDGDKRIGFITMGLLGSWGEWHTYPMAQLFASQTTQKEVMSAFQAAFTRTPILMRIPMGKDDSYYAANNHLHFGYHDDSFAWQSLDTPSANDGWYFETRLKKAKLTDRWKIQPIGGEVRPEVWDCLFDEPSCAPQGQEFLRGVEKLHVSWLLNTGPFEGTLDLTETTRTTEGARRLGYEFQILEVVMPLSIAAKAPIDISLSLTNRGVAPIYHELAVEIEAMDHSEKVVSEWKTEFRLTGFLPGEKPRIWMASFGNKLPPGNYLLAVRVVNPLPAGKPLRFANEGQARNGATILGEFKVE